MEHIPRGEPKIRLNHECDADAEQDESEKDSGEAMEGFAPRIADEHLWIVSAVTIADVVSPR